MNKSTHIQLEMFTLHYWAEYLCCIIIKSCSKHGLMHAGTTLIWVLSKQSGHYKMGKCFWVASPLTFIWRNDRRLDKSPTSTQNMGLQNKVVKRHLSDWIYFKKINKKLGIFFGRDESGGGFEVGLCSSVAAPVQNHTTMAPLLLKAWTSGDKLYTTKPTTAKKEALLWKRLEEPHLGENTAFWSREQRERLDHVTLFGALTAVDIRVQKEAWKCSFLPRYTSNMLCTDI